MATEEIHKNGFTLVELIVIITLIGVISVLAAGIIQIGINNYLFVSAHSIMVREAQNAIEILNRRILTVNPDQILNAQSTQFSFTNPQGNTVEFEYIQINGQLRYRVLGESNWRIILNNITPNGFTFTYMKTDGSAWVVLSEIRRVQIEIFLNLADENADFNTEIYIRNG